MSCFAGHFWPQKSHLPGCGLRRKEEVWRPTVWPFRDCRCRVAHVAQSLRRRSPPQSSASPYDPAPLRVSSTAPKRNPVLALAALLVAVRESKNQGMSSTPTSHSSSSESGEDGIAAPTLVDFRKKGAHDHHPFFSYYGMLVCVLFRLSCVRPFSSEVVGGKDGVLFLPIGPPSVRQLDFMKRLLTFSSLMLAHQWRRCTNRICSRTLCEQAPTSTP